MKSMQDAIESLHAKELCPRIHVDVTHPDAVCPDFVVERWKQRLVIDLDPSYPLDLAFTEIGVEADLSFGGFVSRCVFPWAAIYVVADRATGRGQVFPDNVPASLRADFGLPPAPPALDRELTEVRDDAAAKKSGRRRKRRGSGSEAEAPTGPRAVEDPPEDEDAELDEGADADEDAAEDTAAEETAAQEQRSDEVAQTRRSAFRVIDGGS